MQRRSLMKLGVASAVVLAVAGGGIALVTPGLADGKLGAAGRAVFRAAGAAILEGSLPQNAESRETALDGLLDRVDALVLALPPHVQKELSLLLSLLASAPGRQAIAGLGSDWSSASVPQLQQALQSMRVSMLSLRQQAYHALHDIVGGAYFSHVQTWAQLGYPGPLKI
jgi:hypothetical protein